MKRLVFSIFWVFTVTFIFAQKYTPEIICSTDTVTVEPMRRMFIKESTQLSSYDFEPYKAVNCIVPTKLALRLDVGVSGYSYGDKTKEWLGNHCGPNFALAISYDKFSLGARFKPWTVNPKKELEFNGNLLPLYAKLNPIKIDFYAGYSFDFDYLISVEPQIGIAKSLFYVINETELNQTYSIPKVNGLLIGCSVNKYFKFGLYDFFAVFLNMGYATNNFTKTHPSLDKGYFEWTLGVSIKSFYKSSKMRKITE
ncbi:MAG: hypothetical protein BWZ00_01634 [Bacteroidetes bacterium ADurb.BinA174]|nr:MAG: hypothetical protein BWZ00_01634 [Bacteroidetes bacterium ADurb.BinA174]